MNKTVAWYLVSNLPSVYVKTLASENGTVLERLKNCLLVRLELEISMNYEIIN